MKTRFMKMKLTLTVFLFSGFSLVAIASNLTVVTFKTTKGNFEVELNSEKAPISVDNFLNYVDAHFYDGLIVHRVIPNFVIQGGGHYRDLSEKPTNPPIVCEAGNGLSNLRGTIAVPRTSEVNSGTSQFFINLKDNLFLDHKDETETGFGYAVFGRVISGMEVVDAIALVPTVTKGEFEDVPDEDVVILTVERKL